MKTEVELKSALQQALPVLRETSFRIKDDPLALSYHFVDNDGKDLLTLSISELKVIGPAITQFFRNPGDKDIAGILRTLEAWSA